MKRDTAKPRDIDLEDFIIEVCTAVAGRSAILQRLAEASVTFERGGTHSVIDPAFWRGVDALMHDNVRDLARLEARVNGGHGTASSDDNR